MGALGVAKRRRLHRKCIRGNVALGLIAAIIAARPGPYGRLVLLTLALPPLAAAMLQVLYLGFILPTAILLLDTVLLVAAAIATPWSTATPSA